MEAIFERNKASNNGNSGSKDREMEDIESILRDIDSEDEGTSEETRENIVPTINIKKNEITIDYTRNASRNEKIYRNAPTENLQSIADDEIKSKSAQVARVWKPTEQYPKKPVKKNISWPLKSVFMFKDESNNDEKDGTFYGENNDEEAEGDTLVGDYFDDSDWLMRKTELVNFSPSELENMNLMDSLSLFPPPSERQNGNDVTDGNDDESGFYEADGEADESRFNAEFGPGSNRGGECDSFTHACVHCLFVSFSFLSMLPPSRACCSLSPFCPFLR